MNRVDDYSLSNVTILLSKKNKDYLDSCIQDMPTNSYGDLMILFTLHVLHADAKDEILSFCEGEIKELSQKESFPEEDEKPKIKHLSLSGKYLSEKDRTTYKVDVFKFRIRDTLHCTVKNYCDKINEKDKTSKYEFTKNKSTKKEAPKDETPKVKINPTMFYIAAICYCRKHKLPSRKYSSKEDICEATGLRPTALDKLFMYLPEHQFNIDSIMNKYKG